MKTPELTNEIKALSAKLIAHHWIMGTAESCTGGAIATALTDIPGSSEWFAGSVVTYTIPWKIRLLGVPQTVIDQYGVVSTQTVTAMLQGLQAHQFVQAGIAVSGIAGPTGAEPGKPIGTVCIGACASTALKTQEFHFEGDREAVRAQAVSAGVKMLLKLLETA